MFYVLYNVKTTKMVKPKSGYSSYNTAAAAKRAMTVNGLSDTEYAVTDDENFYNNIEKTEIRKNFMTGKEFVTRVNTAYTTCPSSETYWSS